MNYLRLLYCYLFGHETYTVSMPLAPDGKRHEILRCCMRCHGTQQMTIKHND